jgi:DNA-binding response OmpR family regulator
MSLPKNHHLGYTEPSTSRPARRSLHLEVSPVIANPEPAIIQQKRLSVPFNRRKLDSRWTFRVLIVTPHRQQGSQLEHALQEVGYRTSTLEHAEDIRAFLRHQICDALILDLDQLEPSLAASSLQAFRDLRLSGLQIPTMVLGNGAGLEQRVAAFDAGGDDYQTKPCPDEEMLARLRSILRRTNPHLALNLDWRGLHMNWASRTASVDGRKLPLNLNEFTFFEVLASVPGRVISALDLRLHLDFKEGSNLHELVQSLNAKLGMNVIETVAGEGFRFPPGE